MRQQRSVAARLGVYAPLIAVAFALVLFAAAFTNRTALLRRVTSPSRALADAPVAAASTASGSGVSSVGGLSEDDTPTPNCGLPARPANIAAQCKADQTSYYDANKQQFWGGSGYERTMGSLFNRFDGKTYFPRSRPMTIVHVGAQLGGMIDRYAALQRGPRLDDRIILIEPNPMNVERLSRRIRMDPRLSVLAGAAWESNGEVWFEYATVPNQQGGGGKVKTTMPANVTQDIVDGKGAVVKAMTLDSLLGRYFGPVDFIMMDADGHEPWILKGAAETLKRTRFVVFGCNDKWKDPAAVSAGANLDVLDATRKIFEPAGLAVALLGEKRNTLLSPAAVTPDDFAPKMPAWGFCMAGHVAPPVIRKTTEYARLMAGPDAQEGVCGTHFATAPLEGGHCSAEGLMDTLGGTEAWTPQPDEPVFY